MKTTRWHRLLSLSPSEVWFLVEAAATVVGFDLAFRLFSSKSCLALLGRKAAPDRKQKGLDPQRIAWFVKVANRYAPGKSSCLRQTAALAWLLRRRGVATNLRIGVARQEGKFTAHSWLESGDGQVFGLSDLDQYTPLSSPTLSELIQARSER